jgi:hypothetical protein
MQIDFPDHVISDWQRTPWWLFWKPRWRRYHWRWIVDCRGCECVNAWQYAQRGARPTTPKRIAEQGGDFSARDR